MVTFLAIKKMLRSAAVEILSSQSNAHEIKTSWDPPVLWSFSSRSIFLHGIGQF